MEEHHPIQLEKWVNGTPVHNVAMDQCTPDFSCCCSELLAPIETRERFYKAFLEDDKSTQMEMLATFMDAALSAMGKGSIEIIGTDESNNG